MKKLICVLLTALLAVSYWGPGQSAAASSSSLPDNAPIWRVLSPGPFKMDSALQAALKTMKPADLMTVIVTLREQTDLSKVAGRDHDERERDAVRRLRTTADSTQKLLKALLNSRRGQKKVQNFEALWVINGFSVTATSEVVNELARHPDVLTITTDDVSIVPSALGAPEANIGTVSAPALWDMGFTGQGIVVANMDSGVDVSHPDLASRWRGGANSWYDPYGQHPDTPTDMTGHGTWTMSDMVGGDAGGTSIGVAPGAQWIAVKIFNDQGGSTATAIHQGYQWLLDPDNDPNTADAPRVVNNSWTYANPGCYLEFQSDLLALRAAGILPVFAAGNGGPYASSSYSPANNPSAFSVGAISNSGAISGASSRGPNSCGGVGLIYPQVVAPGVNIRAADLYGNYTLASGTSLAAPHVAGGLALLLSAYPNLTADDQQSALLSTTTDLGTAGPDNTYGYGRVDFLAAFNWLAAPPPTNTPTSTATSTDTPLPTETATPTAVPPSATPTSLPPTVIDTATPAPPTFTPTALPPTATATQPALTATRTPTVTRTPTSTKTPTATKTATATRTPTATLPPASLLHIGNLDWASVKSGAKWNVTISILVHNGNELPVANATVTGKWSNGSSGTVTCVTNASGICTVTKTGLGSSTASVTFSVTNISLAPNVYLSSANHDPDGNSNGTKIVALKP